MLSNLVKVEEGLWKLSVWKKLLLTNSKIALGWSVRPQTLLKAICHFNPILTECGSVKAVYASIRIES